MVYRNHENYRIFCAIDEADYDTALQMARRVAPHSKAIKLGMTFFNRNGAAGVRALVEDVNDFLIDPVSLFLDLKMHDIPMQVAGAVRSLVHLEPAYLTIHASGGLEMMQQAANAARDEAEKLGVARPHILGITVLTSLDADALDAVGQSNNPAKQVSKLAHLAKEAGLDGVVCSPMEVAELRKDIGSDFTLMVPGVRPAGSDMGDQKRVMRPAQAIEAGATHMVIGRPITQHDDPAAVIQFIQTEIEKI